MSPEQVKALHALPMKGAMEFWRLLESRAKSREAAVRELVKADLYYLLVRVCGRQDMVNEFAFARCREVEADPNGRLDLWAREHFKSSIITFGLTIQDVLKDPDITIGIFSHTRPIAKAFLRQIMRELEGNRALHAAFPDVLWGEDVRQAPKWSEDDGIIVRRKSNPNEATVEAWGPSFISLPIGMGRGRVWTFQTCGGWTSGIAVPIISTPGRRSMKEAKAPEGRRWKTWNVLESTSPLRGLNDCVGRVPRTDTPGYTPWPLRGRYFLISKFRLGTLTL